MSLGLDISFDVFVVADLETAGVDDEGVIVFDFVMMANAVAGGAGFVGGYGVAFAD